MTCDSCKTEMKVGACYQPKQRIYSYCFSCASTLIRDVGPDMLKEYVKTAVNRALA